jgi:hypothetical protein
MRLGASGFLEAWFGTEGPIETEIPNLDLDADVAVGEVVRKRPASRASSSNGLQAPEAGTPAPTPEAAAPTAAVTAADEEQEAKPGSCEGAAGQRYSVLFYKKDGGVALRRCFGDKKQVWSIRSKVLGSDALLKLARDAKIEVEAGRLSEAAAKDWVLAQLPK